ncbi:hypothetical protein [Azohydromonas aeria]|uniref:hypothetical protein n=1 Tax=Azohydromonas aeria TaxID=2590212 RepID=UPI0012F802ED|nr:hypothetical protein [Azohydromonas aeria]
MTIGEAIEHAKQEVKAGFAGAYMVEDGRVFVLLDDGRAWREFWPCEFEYDPAFDL